VLKYDHSASETVTTPLHKVARRFTSTGLFAGVQSFAELEARIVALPTEQDRGDAFEVFAEAYFVTQPITQARQVWPLEAVPLQVKQRLSVGARDMGIDGIIETTAGNYDAYQVKFRSARSALTWEELSTFMGLSDKASQRIVFTNSNNLPAVINERVGFFCIRGADLARLEPSDFAVMQGWLEAGEIKVLRKSPLPHQQEALVAITSALKQQNRATAVMACGTGKTLVSLWAAEDLNVTRVLVLVPSLALIRQTLHEWLRETRLPSFSYLCVCSDPTVTKGTDNLVLRQSDLDFPVTTEPDAVQRFLAQEGPAVRIVFSTYQSAEVVARGAQGSQPFDLGIFDEAHKTAGREGTRFSFALSDKNLPIQKRLFLTATPRHYDIRHKDKEGDAKLVYSMDVPEIFGPVAYTLSFAEAARRGIICPYKVLVSVVTSEMVTQDLLSHGEVIVEGEPLKAQHVANQIALQQAVQKYGASRIFTFHRSVASAQSFTSPTAEGIGTHLPGFETFHVNGTMRTAERDSMLQAFRHAPRALISNARCLTEGVDVPAVDMVAFMSPRKSKVDIVQATGRAMRKAPDKTIGYVLVPVYVEMHKDETLEQAIQRSDFEDVWDVLQAMMEQDAVLVDIVRKLREERGRTGGYDDSALTERIEMLGPSLSLAELRSAVTALCVESLGVTWDERYGQLIAYKERFGDCNVPLRWSENLALGWWCNRQREAYQNGKLSAERIKRLAVLGFVWDPIEAGWEEMFQALTAFKGRFGSCDVPVSWPENPALGRWCSTQRVAYKKKTLSADRITQLEALGFVWDTLEAGWEEMFQALAAFKELKHHCNVPQGWPDNPALGVWCSTQRRAIKKEELSADRITRLEALSFVWDALDAGWEEMFQALTAYKGRFGNCDVPRGRPENRALGIWCGSQRRAYKKKTLSTDRIARLEALGFAWDTLETAWEEMFQALTAFKECKHHCNVPQGWSENPALGKWCSNQRTAYMKKKLSTDRITRLEALGFMWAQKSS